MDKEEKTTQVDQEIDVSVENAAVFRHIDELYTDSVFLMDVACNCDRDYRENEKSKLLKKNEQIPEYLNVELLTADERNALHTRERMESLPNVTSQDEVEKIKIKYARNIAPLYALVGVLNVITIENPKLSFRNLLRAIVDDNIDSVLKTRLCIGAHSTWISGQPFIGRETKKGQTWQTLSDETKYIDLVVIRAAAQVLLDYLRR